MPAARHVMRPGRRARLRSTVLASQEATAPVRARRYLIGTSNLFLAGRDGDWQGAKRSLSRSFSVTVAPATVESRVYFDTFDWRLFRAGLQLVRTGDVLALADVRTGALVAQAPWPHRHAPRFARDLPADDLRTFVAPVIDPRALLAATNARVRVRFMDVRGHTGNLVAGVRSETATVRSRRGMRTVNGLLLDTPPTGSARNRAGVSRALVEAAFRPSESSWVEIVLRAAGCRPGDHAPRPRAVIDAGTPARTAVVAIFLHLLNVMQRNRPGIIDDIDTEFLHDYRVAVRRTRVGLKELNDVFPTESEVSFRRRFREMAEPTGIVRDLDVLLLRREAYRDLLPDAFRAGLDPFFDTMADTRERAHRRLVAVLRGPECASLMRDWKRALDALARGETGGAHADGPAVDVARQVAGRRYDHVRQLASSVTELDDASLHRVRIDCKRLRYVLEFFETCLGKRAAATVVAMERLQDALGEHNDLRVQMRIFGNAIEALRGTGDDARAQAAALGGSVALIESRRRKVRQRCERRLHAFVSKAPSRL
jgi:CHAD domain-containing protein